jgi:hypothetical protein
MEPERRREQQMDRRMRAPISEQLVHLRQRHLIDLRPGVAAAGG